MQVLKHSLTAVSSCILAGLLAAPLAAQELPPADPPPEGLRRPRVPSACTGPRRREHRYRGAALHGRTRSPGDVHRVVSR